jgi:hypothetical protein
VGFSRPHRKKKKKGRIQEINITIDQSKDVQKCPYGVLVCRHATQGIATTAEPFVTEAGLKRQLTAPVDMSIRHLLTFLQSHFHMVHATITDMSGEYAAAGVGIVTTK